MPNFGMSKSRLKGSHSMMCGIAPTLQNRPKLVVCTHLLGEGKIKISNEKKFMSLTVSEVGCFSVPEKVKISRFNYIKMWA